MLVDRLELTGGGSHEDPDAFVIGASAYMGHWEKEATAFVRQHSALLSNRPVWIFSSGPVGPDQVDAKGRDQLEAARPREFAELPELVNPREQKVFFGAYDPLRKGGAFVERLVMKAPAIRDAMPAGDFRDWPAIEAWARDIAGALEVDRARLAVPV